MKTDLIKKVYIVANASWRESQIIATKLVEQGAYVVVAGNQIDTESSRRAELSNNIIIADADISSEDGWYQAVRETLDRFGQIDHVMNDGSIYCPPCTD